MKVGAPKTDSRPLDVQSKIKRIESTQQNETRVIIIITTSKSTRK